MGRDANAQHRDFLGQIALANGPPAPPVSPPISGDHPALQDPTDLQQLADLLDNWTRPWVDDGTVPAALFVDTDAGDNDNDGQTVGTPVLTLERALQFVPVLANDTRTINITGATPAALPATAAALNRITLQGAFTVGGAQVVTGVVGSSRAAGAILQGVAVGVGDVIEWLTGPLAGRTGLVYAVAGPDSFITQTGLVWIAPTIGDTIRVRTPTVTLLSPAVSNPTLMASSQLRFNDLIVEDLGGAETLFGVSTDNLVFERCVLRLMTLVSGRGGSVALSSSWVENIGNANRGLISVPTGGVLTLADGSVVTGSGAASTATAHISIASEGVVGFAGEVVLDQLGDLGVDCVGSEITTARNPLAGPPPAPTLRFRASLNGWKFNAGRGVAGSADLPDTFGAVASAYLVTATAGAWVRLGSASACATASVPNAVSADNGATASATNPDQTRIENGTPAPGSGSRSIVFAIQESADLGAYRTRTLGGAGAFNYSFAVPSDFGSVVALEAIISPSAGAAGLGKGIDLASEYASVGEATNTHAESDIGTLYDLSGTDGTWFSIDISIVFTAIAPGDLCGLTIDNKTVGGGIDQIFVRMIYMPT